MKELKKAVSNFSEQLTVEELEKVVGGSDDTSNSANDTRLDLNKEKDSYTIDGVRSGKIRV